jgi:transposase
MLGVGLDWAEAFHIAALGRPQTGVTELRRIEHTPAGLRSLIERIRTLEPDPAQVRVVVETRHGLLVDALLAAGFTVMPVNPDLVARRRGPAGKKDDPEDARICCLLAIDPHTTLRPLVAHSPLAAELRSIARDDARLGQDQRRLLNRLRADLLAVFPAALQISDGTDLNRTTLLRLLAQWPTATALATVGRVELLALARRGKHRYPERFADRVLAALGAEQLTVRDELARAKADTIALTATQLLAIHTQRQTWERRMGQLLLGAPRVGRARQPRQQPREGFPGGEVYLSFPGLGDRLAARVAGEIGDDISQFRSPNALQCYAGRAPVTRRSGRSEYVVCRRLAFNHFLGEAVQHWAFCSLRSSAWAREFYASQRHRGKSHNAALRALGNRWLEVLWHCLHRGVPYDEATHTANRQRASRRHRAVA